MWAALAGARVAPNGWRRARAMLHFDRTGELKRRFLLTAVQRNKNPQLRLRALQEIAALRDAEAFDQAIDIIGGWPRDERREGAKVMLQALAEQRIGRRDQANAWIWRLAEYTREVHEEYAVQRWPETKRLLGLLVNSSAARTRATRGGSCTPRASRTAAWPPRCSPPRSRTRPRPRRSLRGARTRMARKPAALARELLRNFPKGRARAPAGAGARRPSGRGEPRRAAAKAATAVDDGRDRRRAATPRTRPRRRRGGAGARRGRARASADAATRRRRQPTRPTPTTPTTRGRGADEATSTTAPDVDERRRRRADEDRASSDERARGRLRRGLALARRQPARGGPRRRRARRAPPARRRPAAAPRRRRPRRALRRRPSATSRPRSASRARHASSSVAGSARQRALERRQQPLEHRLDARPASRPSVAAVACSSAGSSSSAHRDVDADPDHRPALLRAALDEDPRDLAARRASTSLGHLIRALAARHVGDRHGRPRAAAAAARRAATSDISSALPGGARHVRPWRPRPADCSAAVTSVPCGAPAAASSRARSFVEAVVRRCRRGRPSARAHAGRMRSSCVERERRARRAEPRFTASASVRYASS